MVVRGGPQTVGPERRRRTLYSCGCSNRAAHPWRRDESSRRAGTENVLLGVGLGAACELAESWIGRHSIRKLRDLFWRRLTEEFDSHVVLNGHPTDRLPNTLNVSFPGRVGTEILRGLGGVAPSTASACHSGAVELSPVFKAMRVPPETGMGAIRFSLGRTTTEEEIETVVKNLKSGTCP